MDLFLSFHLLQALRIVSTSKVPDDFFLEFDFPILFALLNMLNTYTDTMTYNTRPI